MNTLWVLVVVLSCRWVNGFDFEELNVTEVYDVQGYNGYGINSNPLLVGLTLIHGAAAKGAVCLDGSLPGYHWHRGWGSGANSWLVNLEGGGWCNDIRSCVYRKTSRRGSSAYMEKQIPFTGILSNKPEENPDFFNWNRVKLRYCDGASFTGDSQDNVHQLQFRGQRIWLAGMEELMSKGMRYANQALLSGCSAGGLATILHCDEFRGLFPHTTKVKCFSDAGMFLDARDVSGGRTLRHMFGGVVNLQGAQRNLPRTCTNHLDPTSCFFPQNLIANIKTPLFLLNAAYDSWQVQASLAPPSADPHGSWRDCKKNHLRCSPNQIRFFQGFRNQMLNAIKGFSIPRQNGVFINSCFTHCQSERQDTWFSGNSPVVHNKGIAQSVGNWYFDRAGVKEIDCPYPCDGTCHNLIFKTCNCIYERRSSEEDEKNEHEKRRSEEDEKNEHERRRSEEDEKNEHEQRRSEEDKKNEHEIRRSQEDKKTEEVLIQDNKVSSKQNSASSKQISARVHLLAAIVFTCTCLAIY